MDRTVCHVRERRESLGWTQAEAAAKVGMTPQEWAKIEGGGVQPRVGKALRMSAALDWPVEDLWEPVPNRARKPQDDSAGITAPGNTCSREDGRD